MKLTLWRSVRRAHAASAFTGDGAARFPGRYNSAGVCAVYLSDCPAGAALEIVATYAAPEAILSQALFRVEVDASLVDLRRSSVRQRYGVTQKALTASDDYAETRRVGSRLVEEKRPGAIVPAATVAEAFNVVIYPGVWDGFVVGEPCSLALDRRILGLVGR